MTDRPSGKLVVALFVLGLLSVAVAQGVLIWRPVGPAARPSWLKGLEPVWPHTGPVVLAIGLFVLGSICWAVATRRLWNEPLVGSAPALLREAAFRSPAALAALALGVALYGGLLWRLTLKPNGPSHGAGFLFSWALILGGLFWTERRTRLPSRPGCPSPRFALWEVLSLGVLLGLFFFLSTFDLRDWYFSSLGDEFDYYSAAKGAAAGEPWAGIFSQRGVYGMIPAASSWFQGMLMRLFGTGLRAWKTAALVPVLASLPLAYCLARILFGRRVAMFTLAMFATAAYLLGYAHTGYPNLEPLLPTLASLLLFVVGLRNGSRVLLVLSGAFAGLGWYTFYSSRAAIVILGAAIVLGVRGRRWPAIGGLVAGGFLLVFLPMLAVNRGELVAGMLAQSLKSTEDAADRAMLPIWNSGRSFLAFNYNIHSGPYMSGSLAEPLTAALFVLGLSYCAATWRDARSRCILAWFTIAVAVTGVLSKYDYVSVSRLHYALPAVVLLAAVGLDRTLRVLKVILPAGKKLWPRVGSAAAITLITASNLHRWFDVAPREAPSSPDAVTIRVLELPICQRAALPLLIVDVGVGGAIPPAVRARATPRPPEFGLYAAGPKWLGTADSRCVVFRSPHDKAAVELMRAIERRFPGKPAVEERDRSGETKIRVYYPRK
jgi:hypothetical protein